MPSAPWSPPKSNPFIPSPKVPTPEPSKPTPTPTPTPTTTPTYFGTPTSTSPTGTYITPTGGVSYQAPAGSIGAGVTKAIQAGAAPGGYGAAPSVSRGGGGGAHIELGAGGGAVVQTPQGGVSYPTAQAALTAQQQLEKSSRTISGVTDTYGKSNLLSTTGTLQTLGLAPVVRFDYPPQAKVENIIPTIVKPIEKGVALFSAGVSSRIEQFLNKPKYQAEQDLNIQQSKADASVKQANPKIEDYNKAHDNFSKKWDSKIKDGNFIGSDKEFEQYKSDYENLSSKSFLATTFSDVANKNIEDLKTKQKIYNQKFESKFLDLGKTGSPLQDLRTVGTSAIVGAVNLLPTIASLGLGLISRPVETLKGTAGGLLSLPSQFVQRPLTTFGTFVGQAAAGYALGGAISTLRGKGEIITKVEKITPQVSKSYTLQDAVKIGENAEGLSRWQVTAKVITNRINPRTGNIIKTMNTDVVSKVITSQTREGVINVLAKADAQTLRSTRTYDFVSKQGMLADNIRVQSTAHFEALTKASLKQAQDLGVVGTAKTIVQEVGKGKARITYDDLISKSRRDINIQRVDLGLVKTRIPTRYSALSNVAIKQIGEGKFAFGKSLTNLYLEKGKVKGYTTEAGTKVSTYPRTYRSRVITAKDLTKSLTKVTEKEEPKPIEYDFSPTTNEQSLALKGFQEAAAKQVAQLQTQSLSSAIARVEKAKPIISKTIIVKPGKQLVPTQITKAIPYSALVLSSTKQFNQINQQALKTSEKLRYAQKIVISTGKQITSTGLEQKKAQSTAVTPTLNLGQLTGTSTRQDLQLVPRLQQPQVQQPIAPLIVPPIQIIPFIPPIIPPIIPFGKGLTAEEQTRRIQRFYTPGAKPKYAASLGSAIFGISKKVKAKDLQRTLAKLSARTYTGIEFRPTIQVVPNKPISNKKMHKAIRALNI